MNETDLTDVIRRARAHDADAFDTLIDCYGARVYGFFYRCVGSRDASEDLTQELFLRVLRTIGGYEHTDRFESWLFRIAGNLVRDRVRRQRRRPAELPIDADEPATAAARDSTLELVNAACASPSARAEHDDEVDRLQQALKELPEAEREVVMLRHFSQLSFAEIADTMRTPLGTALARAHRGLAKLRAILEPSR